MTLSETLSSVWENHVKSDFSKGILCSEKHLQAVLFKWFALEATDVFVEPKLHGENIKTLEDYRPDLLFVQGQEIVGVAELKFSPYYQADTQNDLYRIQTFQKESQDATHKIYLKINPTNGDWNTQEVFTLSKEILFIYGVVAKKGSPALDSAVFAQYSDKQFLHLKLAV
jgi:hypothetical protein